MMECIVRLFKLNMLPESILLMEAEDPESARRRIPRPSNKARNSSAGSMLSRAFSSLISLEGADSGPPGESSLREVEATQRSVSCLNACRVEDIFADSKFLRAESLHELVKAIMWASGPIKRVASSGEESETAQANTLFSPTCVGSPALTSVHLPTKLLHSLDVIMMSLPSSTFITSTTSG